MSLLSIDVLLRRTALILLGYCSSAPGLFQAVLWEKCNIPKGSQDANTKGGTNAEQLKALQTSIK
jgi:hypothetical protein